MIPLKPWANLIVLPDGALLMHQRSDPTSLLSWIVVTSFGSGWKNKSLPAVPIKESSKRANTTALTRARIRCVALARRKAVSCSLGILRLDQSWASLSWTPR